jgi:predicted DCC family thiol-disulfide oxidoreductase YuxK
MATPLGKALLAYPSYLKYLTFVVLGFEFFGPFLAFFPLASGPLRTAVVLLFIGFHVALGLCLMLGLFAPVCIVAWLAFLPTWAWERLSIWLGRRSMGEARNGVRLYYDGDCAFCKKMVLLIVTFLGLNKEQVAPAQNEPKILPAMQQKNSWVIVDHQQKHHYEFAAFIYLCRITPGLRLLAGMLSLSPIEIIGRKMYRWVATHRIVAARFSGSLSYRPLRMQPSKVVQWISLYCLLYVVFGNFRVSGYPQLGRVFPQNFRWMGQVFRLDQRWQMFAPEPRKVDGWYVMPGRLENKDVVDVLRGGAPVSWKKPAFASFDNDMRWSRYLRDLRKKTAAKHRYYYSLYLKREWDRKHPPEKRLRFLNIYFMRKRTLLEGEIGKPRRILIWGKRF